MNRKWIVIVIGAVLVLTAFGIGFSGMVVLARQTEQGTAETDRLICRCLITAGYVSMSAKYNISIS